MEETLNKLSSDIITTQKSLSLFIQSRLIILKGHWTWDMCSQAVYCSDVMHFPPNFEGTKGIVHPDDLQKVKGALELLNTQAGFSLDFRMVTTFGEVKELSGEAISIDHSGNANKETIHPIWEEAVQAMALEKENEFLYLRSELAEASEKAYYLGCWFINKSKGQAWYSDNVFRIHGVPAQSLNAHANTFNSFIHPEDRAAILESFENAYAEELPLHIQYRIVHANGNIRYVRQLTQWSFDRNGNHIFSGIIQEITQEKEQEEHLQITEAQAKLQLQILNYSEQQLSNGYWYMNLVTRKSTYSDNFYRIYGVKPSMVSNHNAFLDLVHPDDKQRVYELMEKMHKEHTLSETEFRIIRPDGKQRILKKTGKVFIHGDKDLMMIAVVQDITVLKGLEKKISELNESMTLQNHTLQTAEEVAAISSFQWLDDGHMQWSDGFFKILGYKPGTVDPSPRLVHRAIHPEDIKKYREAESSIINNKEQQDIQFRIISRVGLRLLNLSFRRIAHNGKEMVLGLVQDFTGQNEIQQKLSEAVRLADMLAKAIDDVILITDSDYNVVSWNGAAEEKTGIKKEDATGHNFFDLFPVLNENSFQKHLHAAMNGEEVNIAKLNYGYLKIPHSYSLLPFKNESGMVVGVLHVVQDISRELELQQQLSERLNFIENLVEASAERIVVLDKNMNYLYWNRKAEDHYCITKERIIGRNILEVFPSFRNDPDYQQFRTALKGEMVHIPATMRNDSDEYFETYLIPIKNEGGEVTAVLWKVHDLRRKL